MSTSADRLPSLASLLAMHRESQGVAGQVVTRRGISHAQVRKQVLSLLTGESEQKDRHA